MINKCSSEMVERKTYYKKKSVRKDKVSSKCIKDSGNIKINLWLRLSKEDIGILGNFGYSLKIPFDERINAIKKAMKQIDILKILRHLNALRTLFKSNEKYYDKLNKDLHWIQKYYKKHKNRY